MFQLLVAMTFTFLVTNSLGVASFINGFNKTEAAVFSCRLCFLRAFPFISLEIGIIK